MDNLLYKKEKVPLAKLYKVSLLPPKDTLTGKDQSYDKWSLREEFIVRADDPGTASAKAEAYFNADGKNYAADSIEVFGVCTENPDIFTRDSY